jgi:cell division protease FtsH
VKPAEPVPYSELEKALAAGRIERVVVTDHQIVGYLKKNDAMGRTALSTNRIEADIEKQLAPFKVPYTREYGESGPWQLLGWLVPPLIFCLIWYLMFRGVGSAPGGTGLMSIGKSHAKVMMEKTTGVTFADVAGVDGPRTSCGK